MNVTDRREIETFSCQHLSRQKSLALGQAGALKGGIKGSRSQHGSRAAGTLEYEDHGEVLPPVS
jgi:hypothetical protein